MSFATTPAAPAIPAGFVLVPIEPTPQMLSQGLELTDSSGNLLGSLLFDHELAGAYRLMIAGAVAMQATGAAT